tara:strand:- start:778 stop:1062 length:285 start_codon:yes stop_codon:yes gene_type:complete
MMPTPKEVNDSLDDLRPYVEADGGYLEFVELEDIADEDIRMYYGVKKGDQAYVAKVRLSGACETCAMSAQTLKMGIERHLTMKFPEIVAVVQVM